MRVKVRLMRREGRNLHQREQAELPPFEGELVVQQTRDPELGRQVLRARLVDPLRGTGHDVLPELNDALLLTLEDKTMRFAGFERINKVGFAQTWSVEVA
jgi:hypothetical protein